MFKYLSLLSILLTGCATARISAPKVDRVDFTEGVSKSDRELVCVYIDKQSRLYCMSKQEWNYMQEPEDPAGLDTGREDIIPLLEKR